MTSDHVTMATDGMAETSGGDHLTSAYSKQTFTFPGDSPAAAGTASDIATAVDDVSEDLPMSVKTPYRLPLVKLFQIWYDWRFCYY